MERFEFESNKKNEKKVKPKYPNEKIEYPHYAETENERRLYDLFDAIEKNDVKEVRRLLKSGVNPNECLPGPDTNSVFFDSLKRMSPEVLELLYRHGAEIYCYDSDGGPYWSVFHELAMMDRADLIERLLDLGADYRVVFKDGTSVLHAVALNKNALEVVLSKTDLDVNHHAEDGTTPLFDAAVSGGDDEVKLLLQHGARINERDWRGYTALHQIVIADLPNEAKIEGVKRLLRAGADRDAEGNDGKTPLSLASEEKNVGLAKVLLRYDGKSN